VLLDINDWKVLSRILADDELGIAAEENTLDFIGDWMEQRSQEEQERAEQLWQCVRPALIDFAGLEDDYVEHVPKHILYSWLQTANNLTQREIANARDPVKRYMGLEVGGSSSGPAGSSFKKWSENEIRLHHFVGDFSGVRKLHGRLMRECTGRMILHFPHDEARFQKPILKDATLNRYSAYQYLDTEARFYVESEFVKKKSINLANQQESSSHSGRGLNALVGLAGSLSGSSTPRGHNTNNTAAGSLPGTAPAAGQNNTSLGGSLTLTGGPFSSHSSNNSSSAQPTGVGTAGTNGGDVNAGNIHYNSSSLNTSSLHPGANTNYNGGAGGGTNSNSVNGGTSGDTPGARNSASPGARNLEDWCCGLSVFLDHPSKTWRFENVSYHAR